MNVLLFKKDLDTISDSDIYKLAKMYNLTGHVTDLRWLIAIKHAQKTPMLSGGVMSFVERLPELQRVAVERNDPSFPDIDKTYIQELLDLIDKQKQFKKNLRKMSIDEKRDIELRLTNEEKRLKGDQNWQEIQNLREEFGKVPQQYFSWALKAYMGGSPKYLQDIDTLVSVINEFEWLRKNKSTNQRLQKFVGMSDLQEFLKKFDLREYRQRLAKEEQAKSGAEVLYDGPDVRIIKPKNVEAACYYGRGTKWCTAATKSENMFDYYTDYDPQFAFYIIQPKNPERKGKEKYQIHFGADQYMDELDKDIDFSQLVKKYPGVKKLREYTNKFAVAMLKEYINKDDLKGFSLINLKEYTRTEKGQLLDFSLQENACKISRYLLDETDAVVSNAWAIIDNHCNQARDIIDDKRIDPEIIDDILFELQTVIEKIKSAYPDAL